MKIGALPIILIGVAVGVISLSFALFHHWMPNKEETTAWQDYKSKLDAIAAQESTQKQKIEDAKEIVNQAAAEWRGYVATRTPPYGLDNGGISLAVNSWQLTVDTFKFRNNIQRALNNQVKRGGVEVLSSPRIPDPDSSTGLLASFYNYPSVPFPVVMWNLGAVTVRGTYSQIMANVRSWSRMPNYLAVASGLQISGTSPKLTGTYNLALVGFIRGNVIFAPVQDGSAAATPAGGPGGGFGAPAGAPPGGSFGATTGPGGPGRPGMPGGPPPNVSGIGGPPTMGRPGGR